MRMNDLFLRLKDRLEIELEEERAQEECDWLRLEATDQLRQQLGREPTETEVHLEMIRERTSEQVDNLNDETRDLLDRPTT